MLIYTKITEVQAILNQFRRSGKTIGFVPTMGALHQGHISLIHLSKQACDVTVCSIFVNPTQFNDKQDLERYPRMPEADANLLSAAGCDLLFLPSVDEMYPEGAAGPTFEFGTLDKVLEGAHRPGHFNGVAQVVKRFFEIVEPQQAFFGSKDYQQTLIVKALVKQMKADIRIVTCPILREADGLAMSSRNALLSPEERKLASLIPALMKECVALATQQSISLAKERVQAAVQSHPAYRLDYFEVCEAETLLSVNSEKAQAGNLALIALFVGKIRLIDNLFV